MGYMDHAGSAHESRAGGGTAALLCCKSRRKAVCVGRSAAFRWAHPVTLPHCLALPCLALLGAAEAPSLVMHLDDVADGATDARTDDGGASSAAMLPFDPPSARTKCECAHLTSATVCPACVRPRVLCGLLSFAR